jgi:hypothetical protein
MTEAGREYSLPEELSSMLIHSQRMGHASVRVQQSYPNNEAKYDMRSHGFRNSLLCG